MKNRLQQLFDHKKQNLLSIYFTAGYPNIDDTDRLILALDNAGVDFIEIGFPFSDPLADGPTIQASGQKAIENGMTLKLLFEQLSDLRSKTQLPIVLMGYLNPVLQYGVDAFILQCKNIGIDGVILPDLPLNYYEAEYKSKFDDAGISNILLITPETSEERIQQIDSLSNAFIYMVSSNSITGANKKLDAQQAYYDRVKSYSLSNPTIIGFGIHDSETFEFACKNSSGAIIGSAFIKEISNNGTLETTISNFIKNIRK